MANVTIHELNSINTLSSNNDSTNDYELAVYDTEDNSTKKMSFLKIQLNDLETNSHTLSGAINELKGNIDNLSGLSSSVSSLNNSVTSLNNSVSTLNSSVSNLNNSVGNKLSTSTFNTFKGNFTNSDNPYLKIIPVGQDVTTEIPANTSFLSTFDRPSSSQTQGYDYAGVVDTWVGRNSITIFPFNHWDTQNKTIVQFRNMSTAPISPASSVRINVSYLYLKHIS